MNSPNRSRLALALVAALSALALVDCAGLTAQIADLKLINVRPDRIKPARSSMDFAYNLTVNSPNPVPVPIPIDTFDMGVFLDGAKAADSQLPAGTKAIKVGQPVHLQSTVVLEQVKDLANKMPELVLKENWDVAIKGKVGLKGFHLPVDFAQSVPNPVKTGALPGGTHGAPPGLVDADHLRGAARHRPRRRHVQLE